MAEWTGVLFAEPENTAEYAGTSEGARRAWESRKRAAPGSPPPIPPARPEPVLDENANRADVVAAFTLHGTLYDAVPEVALVDGGWVIDSKLFDKRGEYLGEAIRGISADGATIEHESLDIEPDQQGKGIGAEFLRDSVAMYARSGIEQIDVLAVSALGANGAYTWARLGFELSPEPNHLKRFADKMAAVGLRLDEAGTPSTAVPDASWEALTDAIRAGKATIQDVLAHPKGKDFLLGKYGSVSWRGRLKVAPPGLTAAAVNTSDVDYDDWAAIELGLDPYDGLTASGTRAGALKAWESRQRAELDAATPGDPETYRVPHLIEDDVAAGGRYIPMSWGALHDDDAQSQEIADTKATPELLADRVLAAVRLLTDLPAPDIIVGAPSGFGADRLAPLRAEVARRMEAFDGGDLIAEAFDAPDYRRLPPPERAASVAGRFTVKNPDAIVGRHVLVIDDVWATGSQLRAIRAALFEAGAEKVSLAVAAEALPPRRTSPAYGLTAAGVLDESDLVDDETERDATVAIEAAYTAAIDLIAPRVLARLQSLTAVGGDNDHIITDGEWEDIAHEHVDDVIGDSILDGIVAGASQFRRLASPSSVLRAFLAAANAFAGFANQLRANIETWIGNKIGEDIQGDWGIGKVVEELAKSSPLSKDKATLVVGSEIQAGVNAGLYAAMEAAPPAALRWVTQRDDRVRPAHVDADTETVPFGEVFTVGGYSARFPGDPNLPPALRFNCRCELAYVDGTEARRVIGSTKAELRAKATGLSISGRAKMNKGQLQHAVLKELCLQGMAGGPDCPDLFDQMNRPTLLTAARGEGIAGRHRMSRDELVFHLRQTLRGGDTAMVARGYSTSAEFARAQKRAIYKRGRAAPSEFAANTIPAPEARRRSRQALFDEFGGPKSGSVPCVHCGLRLNPDPAQGLAMLVPEPIVPWSQGGSLALSNLVPSCPACFRARGGRGLVAAGTSEGARKAWESRARAHPNTEQIDALTAYHEQSFQLNLSLRGLTKTTPANVVQLGHLDALMADHRLAAPAVLHRVVDDDAYAAKMRALEVGDTFTEEAFTSTTKDPDLLSDFETETGARTTLHITARQGTHAIDMNDVIGEGTYYYDQAEVLLDRGAQLVVDRKGTHQNNSVIYAHVIGTHQSALTASGTSEGARRAWESRRRRSDIATPAEFEELMRTTKPYQAPALTTEDAVRAAFALHGTKYDAETGHIDDVGNGIFDVTVYLKDKVGKNIGVANRVISEDGTEVEHSVFILNEDAQGQGIGAEFLRDSVAMYAAHGVKRVTTEATSNDIYKNGAYTWARLGFTPTSRSRQMIGNRYQEAAGQHQKPPLDDDALMDRIAYAGRFITGQISIRELASDPIGKKLLLGDYGDIHWNGYIDVEQGLAASAPIDTSTIDYEAWAAAELGLDNGLTATGTSAGATKAWETRDHGDGDPDPGITAEKFGKQVPSKRTSAPDEWFASPAELRATRALIERKVAALPRPTRAEIAKNRRMLKRAETTGRAGGELRGNSTTRRERGEALFAEFGGDKRGYCACGYCGIKVSPRGRGGYAAMQQDKILTAHEGGHYGTPTNFPNLIPSCGGCNSSRNDEPYHIRPSWEQELPLAAGANIGQSSNRHMFADASIAPGDVVAFPIGWDDPDMDTIGTPVQGQLMHRTVTLDGGQSYEQWVVGGEVIDPDTILTINDDGTLTAAGTSEGARKAWQSRQRAAPKAPAAAGYAVEASVPARAGFTPPSAFFGEMLAERGAGFTAATVAEVKQLMAEAPIAVRMSDKGIKGLLRNQRFKTMHETRTSRDLRSGNYRRAREEYEGGALGVDMTDKAGTPVYGYLAGSAGVNMDMGSYGDFEVVLRDDVKNRATVTAGDSLDHQLRPVAFGEADTASDADWWLANPAAHREFALAEGRTYREATWADGSPIPRPQYIEAQVYGGVKLSDVREVIVTSGVLEDMPAAYRAAFAKAGIKVSVPPEPEWDEDGNLISVGTSEGARRAWESRKRNTKKPEVTEESDELTPEELAAKLAAEEARAAAQRFVAAEEAWAAERAAQIAAAVARAEARKAAEAEARKAAKAAETPDVKAAAAEARKAAKEAAAAYAAAHPYAPLKRLPRAGPVDRDVRTQGGMSADTIRRHREEAVARHPRLEMLGETLKIEDSIDNATVAKTLADLDALPDIVLQRVGQTVAGIYIGGSGVKVPYLDKAQRLATQRPRGYPEGSTWKSVGGAYMGGEKRVLIGDSKNSGSASTARHELSHALDAVGHRGSGSQRLDFAALHGRLAAARTGSSFVLPAYYRQEGDAGRSELFAEGLANYTGGEDMWRHFTRWWPTGERQAGAKFFKEHLKRLTDPKWVREVNKPQVGHWADWQR